MRTIPVAAIKFQRREKGKYIVPFFLKDDDEVKIERVAEYYEGMCGRKIGDFDEKSIVEIMGDMKVGRAVQSVMSDFYCFRSPDFSGYFSSREVEVLDKMGVSSAGSLRGLLFEFVNERYGGFCGAREKVILEFADKWGLGKGVDDALWCDHDDEKVLGKCGEVKDVVLLYNQGVIKALFSNSENVRISFPELPGRVVRRIYLLCKYNGVLCDISVECGGYILEISGPVELFGKPEKYGNKIGNVALGIFGVLEGVEYSFTSVVFIKNRKYVFSMEYGEVNKIGVAVGGAVEDKFDSAPEEKFYGFFMDEKLSWKVEREPAPIVAEEFVYVPDFSFLRGDSKVFVEIMGYFTEYYQKKKIWKLGRLKEMKVPMIIVASSTYDEGIKREIEDVGYPVVYFKGKNIPYGPVLRVLEEKFSDFDERLCVVEKEKERIAAEIEGDVLRAGFVSISLLKEKFGCFTDDEFDACMDVVGVDGKENGKGVYVRGAGVFSVHKIEELRGIVSAACSGKRDRGYVAMMFLDAGVDVVDVVVGYLGYGVRWQGLSKTQIIKKKKRS